jgi:ABC transporter DrrB family efflux protein
MTVATSTGTAPAQPVRPVARSGHHAVSDALAIAWRNLLTLARLPQTIVFSTLQPIIFVLMFRYVFGGSMRFALAQQPALADVDYVDFLMPGIFVQTALFGSISTGIGLAEDQAKGLIERFRSLPMARSAVLAGRTIADTVRNVFVIVLMTVVGLLVGFRPDGSPLRYGLAMLLVLLFSYAFSWVVATVGLSVPNAETAQAAVFPLIAPLVFASSAFAPTQFMPGWLQAFADHQPVSITIEAARRLVLDQPVEQYVWGTIAWSVALVAVFGPLAVRQYRRAE